VSCPARPDYQSRIDYRTIGSANIVVKDGTIRDRLKKDMDILCIKIKAAGLMKSFLCLVIRGICDYADSYKNKRWQPYVAAVAVVSTTPR
jgi:nucleoside phosphorylase